MICCPSDNIAGRPRADIRTWAGQFRGWNTDHFRPPNLFSFLTIPFRSFFLLRSLFLCHFMFLYLCLLLSVCFLFISLFLIPFCRLILLFLCVSVILFLCLLCFFFFVFMCLFKNFSLYLFSFSLSLQILFHHLYT